MLRSGKTTSGTACLSGETAFLDEMGFPSSPTPQPSVVTCELAVAFTKHPAQIKFILIKGERGKRMRGVITTCLISTGLLR